MPWITLTKKAGASFGNTGKFFYSKPVTGAADDTAFTELNYPSNLNPTATRGSVAIYNGDGVSRAYIVGHSTGNMVFTEDFRWIEQGIFPFTNEVVNAAGANLQIGVRATTPSTVGITGNVIVYFSKWDDIHGRRSSLSAGSPVIALSNQALLIDNLPTSDPDPSVTHIEVWHSVDGSLPALALRRQLGVSQITEEVATLSLGEVFDQSFERFPRCKLNAIYHERQAMAGDDRHPDRLYLSELTHPERYAGLFLRTRQGEPITAIAEVRDHLLVFGPRSTYLVQGYTEDDLEMQVLEPQIGCMNHFGIINVHGLLIIPSHLGFYISTGTSFHFISMDFQDTWRQEYAANEVSYQSESWGAHDPERNVYKFWVKTLPSFVTRVLSSTISGTRYGYWVLDYTPLLTEVGGSFDQPELSFDVRMREDGAGAILTVPGSSRGYLYTGSCDGIIRQENYADNNDDDGDTYGKAFHIRTKHYIWTPGGGPDDGWRVTDLWSYMVNESEAVLVDGYFGDEEAWQHVQAQGGEPVGDWSNSVPAGLKTLDTGSETVTLEPRTVIKQRPDFSGRGVSFAWTIQTPSSDVAWRGFGGARIPGPNYRGPILIENVQ